MNEHYVQTVEVESRAGLARYSARERAVRNPRIFASGDLKLLLLELIGQQPCHGYDLIQQIEGLFDGAYSPSPGVIYPALAFLESGELVGVASQGDKKNYSITESGRAYLIQQQVALNGVHIRIDVSRRSLRGHDRPPEIHEAMHNVRHALQLHQGHWSPAEVQRVHDLLNNTAKAIVDGLPSIACPAQEQPWAVPAQGRWACNCLVSTDDDPPPTRSHTAPMPLPTREHT